MVLRRSKEAELVRRPRAERATERRFNEIELLLAQRANIGAGFLERFASDAARLDALDGQLASNLARLDQVEADVQMAIRLHADAATHIAGVLESVDEHDETVQRLVTGLRTIATVLLELAPPITSDAPRTS